MPFTPAFQSISQQNNYTGEVIKIRIAVEFPTLETAQEIASRLNGKLVPVPANLSNLYVTWYDDETGNPNVDRYDLSYTPEDRIYPASWNIEMPDKPAALYETYNGAPPQSPTGAAPRVAFSLNAGRLAHQWLLANETASPAYASWSAGKLYMAYSMPEQRARNLILLAERDAYRAASNDPSAASLFPAG